MPLHDVLITAPSPSAARPQLTARIQSPCACPRYRIILAVELAAGMESDTQSPNGEQGLSRAHQQGVCLLSQVSNSEKKTGLR